MTGARTIKVAIVDDHTLFRRGVAQLIDAMDGMTVILQAENGVDLLNKLEHVSELPEVCLVDVNMPEMNGYETVARLKAKWPDIKSIALSVHEAELSIIRMIRNGASGYLLKDCDPYDLRKAIHEVAEKGYHHSDVVTGRLLHVVQNPENAPTITDIEMQFLGLCCSELTYKEIGEKMNLSGRTVEGYRNALFSKLHVNTRAGLVLYAAKAGLIPHHDH